MEHSTKEHEGKHVALDGMSPYQRFMHKAVMRLIEISTLELLVAFLHLALTAAAIFGIVGATGGEGGH